MSKVSRYKLWKRLRDGIPKNSKDSHERAKREKYAFNARMTKPSDRDWAEYAWEQLQKESND